MRRGNSTLIILILFFAIQFAFGQNRETLYELNLSGLNQQLRFNFPGFSGMSPDGTELGVNNIYFEKNHAPWFPLMGELHYIRYPEKYWEEEILKMKSGGLVIIATYVFWNAHENSKGTWNWRGIRDLHRFTELCRKHGMYVWLRIGPWSHGEQLFGGFPEWINRMEGKRSNNSEYLAESQKLFNQIGEQTKELYFKDGGPIIGVQLENEFASGDISHIGTLKKMALQAGITPVYFTVTANTVFQDKSYEAITLQGAYPYRGWEPGGGKATKDFLYANDQWIMSDALGKVYYDITQYPKGLCEQGCGSQVTYKNRFTVEPHVIEAHLQNQIGRGMNLVGYYMFHGGTQLRGMKEPGCPESYDFQGPVSEFGVIRQSYKYLKVIHNFIRDFGSDLAKMGVVEPGDSLRDETNTDKLRFVARTSGRSGFLFLNNTQVRIPMPDKTFRMRIQLQDEKIEFPRKNLFLRGQTTAILPFNLDVNSALMKYGTAQPISRLIKGNELFLFLTRIPGMNVELAFDASTIHLIGSKGFKKETKGNVVYITPQGGTELKITASNGKKSTIVILTREEAENSWRFRLDGQESIIISKADLMLSDGKMEFRQFANSSFEFKIFPSASHLLLNNGKEIISESKGIFRHYLINLPTLKPDVSVTKISTTESKVEIPTGLPENLSDIFLDVDYLGGSADASLNGQILSDDLFHGTSWLFGLKRYLLSNNKSELKFRANAWKDGTTGVSGFAVKQIKQNGIQIRSINVIPQYHLFVTY